MTHARFLSASALVLALGALPACAGDSDSPFIILRNNAPGSMTCVESPSETSLGQTRGLADAQRGDYLLLPLVKNFASSKAGTLVQQRTVIIQGARVEVTFADPDLFTAAELTAMRDAGLTRFETHESFNVAPDGGLAAISTLLLPADLMTMIAAKLGDGESTQLDTSTSVYGEMAGGEVETAAFSFPVEVCDGCLNVSAGACPLPMDFMVQDGGSCFSEELTCCTGMDGADICPAVLATQ